MSEDGPSKPDITAVFKKLRSYPANKVCFDCGAKNPTWASVTYGVFICIDCSAVHRGLGVHLSFVRSTQLDTNWTWLQMRGMQLGGNSNATQFFRQHGCTTTDAQQKYKSRAAQLYREKLHHLAVAAMRMHGTKLHIDNAHGEPHSPTSPSLPKEEEDFFAQHTAVTDVINSSSMPRNESQTSISDEAYIGEARKASIGGGSGMGEEKAPNINLLDDNISTDSGKSASTVGGGGAIGQRRPPMKKAGGKKSAFGAQKVVADFNEIERQAEALEKARITPLLAAAADGKEAVSSTHDAAVAAIPSRFLAQESAKRDEQLKRMDPKKMQQVERLGMAFGDPSRGKASHSVMADIKPINQQGENSRGAAGGFGSNKVREVETTTLDDEWEIIGGPKNTDRSSGWSQSGARKDDNGYTSSSTSSLKTEYSDNRTRRTPAPVVSDVPSNPDVQKKFAGAKAISSDQFFGAGAAADYETRTNLARFEGSNAISSADLFGGGGSGGGGGGYRPGAGGGGGGYSSAVSQLPDMADLKDSVRQGVTKVAGKLSQFSAGMSTYLSEHYGN